MPQAQTAPPNMPPARPAKQIIDVSVDNLPAINAQAWEAITEQNNPPILFTHGAGMVRARYDYHDDGLILDDVNSDIMRHELSEMAHWRRGPKSTITKPPMHVVKNVLASRVIPLPRLNRIVTVPVFGPDGSLLTTPGYNPASGIIYAPPRGYVSLPLPAKIEPKHVDEARAIIEELIQDFPFACDDAGDSPDHDNALALLLLPFVRELIDGPTPLHLIEASMPGSGKGLLATSLLYPSLGQICGAPQPENDAELKKLLTASIKACSPIFYLDNITRPITSGEFAAAITMSIWNDRILGESATVNAKIRALWLITGNNITMSTEITRRTVRVRLTPQTDKPEERSGFKHEFQIEWITQCRPVFVWAAHVLCAWAFQQQLPKAKSKVIGSFERWSRLLGSILECAGYSQFLANYRAVLDGSDTERQALGLFAMTWYEWQKANGRDFATTSELLPVAEGVDGIHLRGVSDKARQTSLGKFLRSKHEVITEFTDDDPTNPVGIYRMKILALGTGKGKFRSAQIWRVEVIEEIPK